MQTQGGDATRAGAGRASPPGTAAAQPKPITEVVLPFAIVGAAAHGDEAAMIEGTHGFLVPLISTDDWLPEEFTCEGDTYRQYLLHCDQKNDAD